MLDISQEYAICEVGLQGDGAKTEDKKYQFQERLTFLVQLDLGAGVGASFLQSCAQVLQVP